MSDDGPIEGELVVYYDENEEVVESEIESVVKELEDDKFAVIVDGEEITVTWDEDWNAWHEVQ